PVAALRAAIPVAALRAAHPVAGLRAALPVAGLRAELPVVLRVQVVLVVQAVRVVPVVLAAVAAFAVLAARFLALAALAVPGVPVVQWAAQPVTRAQSVEPGVGADRTRVVTAALASIRAKARPIARPGWKKHSRSLLVALTRFWLMSNARYPRWDVTLKALAVAQEAVALVAVGLVSASKVVAVAVAVQGLWVLLPVRRMPRKHRLLK
ncbi:MAG: hypothetical protein O6931_02300, partial [Gammaproteobacteria bacterium]|nr:hypothetical protein [Gammaproteobacteria bacterium]